MLNKFDTKDQLNEIALKIKEAKKEIKYKLLKPFTLILNENEIYIDELILYPPNPCHYIPTLENVKNTYNIWEYVYKTSTFMKVKSFIEKVEKTDDISIKVISHVESMIDGVSKSLSNDKIIFECAMWKLMNEKGLIRTKDGLRLSEDFMKQEAEGYALASEDYMIMVDLITRQFFFYLLALTEKYSLLKYEELNQIS